MSLVLILLEHTRKTTYAYYLKMYKYYIEIFKLLVDTLLDAFYISPDVNIMLDLIYNKNVSRSIFDTLDMQRNAYDRHLRSKILDMVNKGTTLAELKAALVDLQKLKKGDMHGQSAKSMSVFRTEYTRVRTGLKLYIAEYYSERGFKVDKTWVYTYESRTARESHLSHDSDTSDKDGNFIINGKKTQGPGMFGDPFEDINCMCDMHLEISGPK